MQSVLLQEGLWSIVDGTEQIPLLTEGGANYSTCQNWSERNQRACGLLWGGLADFLAGVSMLDLCEIMIGYSDTEKELLTANEVWSEIWKTFNHLDWLEDISDKGSVGASEMFNETPHETTLDTEFLKETGAWLNSIIVQQLMSAGHTLPMTCPGLDSIPTKWDQFCKRFPRYAFENASTTELGTLQAGESFGLLQESYQEECRERGLTGLVDNGANTLQDNLGLDALESQSCLFETHQISSLDSGVDFVKWYRQMQIFLLQKGLSSITNGWEPRPSDPSIQALEQLHWDDRDQRAKGILLSALGKQATLRLLAPLRDRKEMSATELLQKITVLYGYIQDDRLENQLEIFSLTCGTLLDDGTGARQSMSSCNDTLWMMIVFHAHHGFPMIPQEAPAPNDSVVAQAHKVIRERQMARFNKYQDCFDKILDEAEEEESDYEDASDELVGCIVIRKLVHEEEDWDMLDSSSKSSTD